MSITFDLAVETDGFLPPSQLQVAAGAVVGCMVAFLLKSSTWKLVSIWWMHQNGMAHNLLKKGEEIKNW